MFDRRALPGTIAGCLALAFAIAAVVTQEPALVLVAGVLTAACVVLVLTLPNRAPVRYRERRDLQEEADKLARENDQMAARAARFEAEAIAAREQLATAMMAERSGVAGADTAPAAAAAAAPAPPGRGDDITDPETGVFTQVFFDASLGKRISAARRGLRPLTVAMVEVVERVGEPDVAQTAAKPVAEILTDTADHQNLHLVVHPGLVEQIGVAQSRGGGRGVEVFGSVEGDRCDLGLRVLLVADDLLGRRPFGLTHSRAPGRSRGQHVGAVLGDQHHVAPEDGADFRFEYVAGHREHHALLLPLRGGGRGELR